MLGGDMGKFKRIILGIWEVQVLPGGGGTGI